MSALHRRFHDSAYNPQVEEALAFVGDNLGLDVGNAKKITVVPPENWRQVSWRLGLSGISGFYSLNSGDVCAVAPMGDPDGQGSGDLQLRMSLVHELTHKGTLEGSQSRSRRTPMFFQEGLAGMGEIAFLDSLRVGGKLELPRDRKVKFSGRTMLPKGEDRWVATALLPGRFLVSDQDAYPSDEVLAAWSLSLAARVSGIGSDEIFAPAKTRLEHPFKLAIQSAVALAPDIEQFTRLQDKKGGGGLRAGIYHIYEAALRAGVVAAPEA